MSVVKSQQSTTDEKVLIQLRKFMAKAFAADGQSNNSYTDLVKMLTGNTKSTTGVAQLTTNYSQLSRIFQTMAKSCSLINEELHETVLELVFGFSMNAPSYVIKDWCNLLINLCVINTKLVQPTIESLVRSFVDKSILDREEEEGSNPPSSIQATNAICSVSDLQDTVHETIEAILRLIPLALATVFSVLMKNFPHKVAELMAIKVYVKNLLRINEYAPTIRDRILTAIVERLLDIDVEINCNDLGDTFLKIEKSMQNNSGEDEGIVINDKSSNTLDDLMRLMLQYLSLVGSCLHQKHEIDDDFPQFDDEEDSSSLNETQNPIKSLCNGIDDSDDGDDHGLGFGMGFMMDDDDHGSIIPFGDDSSHSLVHTSSSSDNQDNIKNEVKSEDDEMGHDMSLMFNHLPESSFDDFNIKNMNDGNSQDVDEDFPYKDFLEQHNNEQGNHSMMSMLADEIFSSLMRVFHRTILRAHKSHFVQFLVFYHCQFKFQYAEILLKMLVDKVISKDTNIVERASATMFIASFIARAKYLRQTTAASTLQILLLFANKEVENYQPSIEEKKKAKKNKAKNSTNLPSVSATEASNHTLFYAVCEAIFYIFIKRQDLLKQCISLTHGLDSPILGSKAHYSTATGSPLLSMISSPSLTSVPLILGGTSHCDLVGSSNSNNTLITTLNDSTINNINPDDLILHPHTPNLNHSLPSDLKTPSSLSSHYSHPFSPENSPNILSYPTPSNQPIPTDPLKFGPLINSPLNPLLYCSPKVTKRFVKIVTHLNLVNCRERVKQNIALMGLNDQRKTHTLDKEGNHDKNDRKHISSKDKKSVFANANLSIFKSSSTLPNAISNAHMPFDPYFLPKSSSFFHDIYLSDISTIIPLSRMAGMGVGLARSLNLGRSHHNTEDNDNGIDIIDVKLEGDDEGTGEDNRDTHDGMFDSNNEVIGLSFESEEGDSNSNQNQPTTQSPKKTKKSSLDDSSDSDSESDSEDEGESEEKPKTMNNSEKEKNPEESSKHEKSTVKVPTIVSRSLLRTDEEPQFSVCSPILGSRVASYGPSGPSSSNTPINLHDSTQHSKQLKNNSLLDDSDSDDEYIALPLANLPLPHLDILPDTEPSKSTSTSKTSKNLKNKKIASSVNSTSPSPSEKPDDNLQTVVSLTPPLSLPHHPSSPSTPPSSKSEDIDESNSVSDDSVSMCEESLFSDEESESESEMDDNEEQSRSNVVDNDSKTEVVVDNDSKTDVVVETPTSISNTVFKRKRNSLDSDSNSDSENEQEIMKSIKPFVVEVPFTNTVNIDIPTVTTNASTKSTSKQGKSKTNENTTIVTNTTKSRVKPTNTTEIDVKPQVNNISDTVAAPPLRRSSRIASRNNTPLVTSLPPLTQAPLLQLETIPEENSDMNDNTEISAPTLPNPSSDKTESKNNQHNPSDDVSKETPKKKSKNKNSKRRRKDEPSKTETETKPSHIVNDQTMVTLPIITEKNLQSTVKSKQNLNTDKKIDISTPGKNKRRRNRHSIAPGTTNKNTI